MTSVTFIYLTGIKNSLFSNARLRGSWDAAGNYTDQWTETPMEAIMGEDGCPAFQATVQLATNQSDIIFHWGVALDGPGGNNLWGIPTELQTTSSVDRYRSFRLDNNATTQTERYYFTYGRRLGANKVFSAPNATPDLRFSVWAPNADAINVVFGLPEIGYIDKNGVGIDPARPRIPLVKSPEDGIWTSEVVPDFKQYEGLPYMYEIRNAQHETVYRTDLFSRSQIGCGGIDPGKSGSNWPGTIATLDGTVSCSVITDPDTIRWDFEPSPEGSLVRIASEDFWAHELTVNRPLPNRVEDLVIYELHIGALGFGKKKSGNTGRCDPTAGLPVGTGHQRHRVIANG